MAGAKLTTEPIREFFALARRTSPVQIQIAVELGFARARTDDASAKIDVVANFVRNRSEQLSCSQSLGSTEHVEVPSVTGNLVPV